MSIENDLDRIANALETIARHITTQTTQDLVADPDGKAEESTPKPKTRRAKPKAEEPKVGEQRAEEQPAEETEAEETEAEETEAEEQQAEASQLEFDDVSKLFFRVLNLIRDNESRVLAIDTAKALLTEYTGGRPLCKEVLPLDQYGALHNRLQKLEAQYAKKG